MTDAQHRGFTERTRRLRHQSVSTAPSISLERALLETEFYRDHLGAHETPVLRALAFQHYLANRKLYIGADELLIGEKSEGPQVVPTYPEICAHTVDDMEVMNSREFISFKVDDKDMRRQAEEVLPYWQGRSTRDKLLAAMTPAWKDCYGAGMFTEFMEQRAPGHTVADGKIYEKGFVDFKAEIDAAIEALDPLGDPDASMAASISALKSTKPFS